jgi:Copper amine oxidase, enzyme domain
MRKSRAAIAMLWLFSVMAVGGAAAQTPPPAMPCSGANLVDQKFPTVGPEITHWRLCWQTVNGNGLLIHWAYFRTAPTKPWLFLLWDARISEIFVPYHSGSPRYYDVGFGFPLTPIGAKDCPATAGGTVLAGNVCKEVHDRGLSWKADSAVYRGEELVLWSALAAANYNYVMEWTFRDDGIVMGRVGATSHNLPGREFETHVHNPIWRLDVDLNGWPNDSVALGTHTENLPGPTATDTDPLIPSEKGLLWDPRHFHSLDVSDKSLVNGKRHKTLYQLIPLPTGGLAQHQEPFTVNDFWVTLYNPAEMSAKDLVSYVSPPQPVSNADVVLWYRGSVHHHPRDEDGEIVQNSWHGVALIMWTGFMLKPHDLFDRTPFYP